MKIAALMALVFLMSCTQAPKSDLKSEKAKLSYAIGQQIGQSLKIQSFDVDASALAMSVDDVLAGRKSALTDEELRNVMMKYQQAKMEKDKAAGAKDKAEGAAFLEKNKSAAGVKVTASGLQYKVVSSGKGKTPSDKDTVIAHYSGHLINGSEFDSSYKRGQPAEFPVTAVIKGWTEALKMMHVGDKWQLFIPSELAYGEAGRPGIPANSVLIFDIELVGIKK